MTTESASSEADGGKIWNLLPSFDPAVDDAREYVEKVRFIASVCPAKDRPMLAPRLAMLCKGTAWAQVRAIDGKTLLQALSVWEEAAELQTFDKVERALFRTTQKSDESAMSYVNRLNVAFHEIRDLTLGQVQAFIMLRQSILTSEDKRKVLVLANGELSPDKIDRAMRSLHTKILSNASDTKKKVYPTNYVDEPEIDFEDIHYTTDADDVSLEKFLQEGDEDALVVQQWEDSLLETLQGDQEMASCLNTYLDARRRLSGKAKNRGFWPSQGGGPKGKGRSKNFFGQRFRKPLAQRILESECRRCGRKGHWKAECPLRNSTASNPARADNTMPVAFTQALENLGEDLLLTVPENATPYQDSRLVECFWRFHPRFP